MIKLLWIILHLTLKFLKILMKFDILKSLYAFLSIFFGQAAAVK